MTLSPVLAHKALDLFASRLGVDLAGARRAELEPTLALAAPRGSSAEVCIERLSRLSCDSPEWRRLASALAVGETYFFRNAALCEALQHNVLPELIAARRAAGDRRLRLWSAGCATGEEPYTLAMMLDGLLPDHAQWSLRLLATDVDRAALAAARQGRYRPWALRATPDDVRQRYFGRSGGVFQLDARIRGMVVFESLNLAENAYPDLATNTCAMDLILCRNVLMYFTEDARRAAVARLAQALVPGGWLVVSAAEGSAELLRPLAPVSFPGAILHRKKPRSPITTTVGAPVGEKHTPEIRAEPSSGGPRRPREVPSAQDRPSPPAAAAQQVPPAPDASPFDRARALADQGQLDEAHASCCAALERQPLDAEGHLLLAAIARERGAAQAAAAALRTAIYLAPDAPLAHWLLGTLRLSQGERQRGRRALETAVRLLEDLPPDETLAGGGGLTAGRLKQTALDYLERL